MGFVVSYSPKKDSVRKIRKIEPLNNSWSYLLNTYRMLGTELSTVNELVAHAIFQRLYAINTILYY